MRTLMSLLSFHTSWGMYALFAGLLLGALRSDRDGVTADEDAKNAMAESEFALRWMQKYNA